MRYRCRTTYFVLLAIFLLWQGDTARASDLTASRQFPLFVRIYDFTIARDLSSVMYTDLEVFSDVKLSVPTGGAPFTRTVLRSTGAKYFYPVFVSTDFEVPRKKPVNSLSSLQRRALLKMLRDGYITKEMYLTVEEAVGIWKPEQLRYAVLWSPVSLEDAKSLFQGNIPWDRVLQGTPGSGFTLEKNTVNWEKIDEPWNLGHIWPKNQPLGITRASLLTATGQTINEQTGELIPLQLSWERSEHFQGIAPLDRKMFPGAVEVSRLLSESGPPELRGDLRIPLQALIAVHAKEAEHLKIPLERYATFGWTLDPRRAAFDYRYFGIRPYDNEMNAWFQRDFADATRSYKSAPFPEHLKKPSESSELKHTLLFGNLEDIAAKFYVTDISMAESRLVGAARGQITTAQARGLIERAYADTFLYFHSPSRFPEQVKPVCLLDPTYVKTPWYAKYIYDLGVHDDVIATDIVHALSELIQINHPDVFSHRSIERGQLVPVENPDNGKEMSPVFLISNVEESAVVAHPKEYLTAILRTNYEYQWRRVFTGGLVVKENMMGVANQTGLSSSRDPEVAQQAIFENTWYCLMTNSQKVMQDAVALGGMKKKGFSIEKSEVALSMAEGKIALGISLFGNGPPAYAIYFDAKAIRQLAPLAKLECAEHVTRGLLIQLGTEF